MLTLTTKLPSYLAISSILPLNPIVHQVVLILPFSSSSQFSKPPTKSRAPVNDTWTRAHFNSCSLLLSTLHITPTWISLRYGLYHLSHLLKNRAIYWQHYLSKCYSKSCCHSLWYLRLLLQLRFCCSIMSNSFATAGPEALQAPLPLGFPKQEYWNGLPFPSPGALPDPGI